MNSKDVCSDGPHDARQSSISEETAESMIKEVDQQPDARNEKILLPTDSMVTISLSEPISTSEVSNDEHQTSEHLASFDQAPLSEDNTSVDEDLAATRTDSEFQDTINEQTPAIDQTSTSQNAAMDGDRTTKEHTNISHISPIEDSFSKCQHPTIKDLDSNIGVSENLEADSCIRPELITETISSMVIPSEHSVPVGSVHEDSILEGTNSGLESTKILKHSSSEVCLHDYPMSEDANSVIELSYGRISEVSVDAQRRIDNPSSIEEPPHNWTRPTSVDIVGEKSGDFKSTHDDSIPEENRISALPFEEDITLVVQDHDRQSAPEQGSFRSRGNSMSSILSDSSNSVDWVKLDKTEEDESRDETSDESTAFLLARLEHENNTLAIDPRFGGLRKRAARPPSIHVLKKLVNDPTAAPTRYSLLPDPPPMTELEFWAALVKDYPQTASRLPTLTTNKIRAGVPPPLRGVVWVSMCGARDRLLGEEFDRLCNESSPYENLISKDIGRSFPGVEMFRDPEGEGQKMLGRVLKCFSLYDEKIGYCQGLGFLVGPLLMQMEDRDAFCVLVRLMENYDLRSCFLPDLSGLHLRIYQFQQLLSQHMPDLAEHLASLQIEPTYLSKWFLSFFAITCPLPMLFRIYDVIFAEGASETMMRVALSLMKRNEGRIMASEEFEEVIQLLLGRALWEPYEHNADYLVNDFMRYSPGGSTATDNLTGLVTRESLKALENAFKEAQHDDSTLRFGIFPDVTTAASRFLGRLLTSSTLKPSLTPGTSYSRPSSMLRRTTSKMSLMTVNSADVGSGSNHSTNSTTSTQMTETTLLSRESAADLSSTDSVASKPETIAAGSQTTMSKENGDLHGQIEDLLTALTETQKNHALMATQLQQEREERCEDYRAFRALTDRLRTEVITSKETSTADRRKTTIGQEPLTTSSQIPILSLNSNLEAAVERVEDRLLAHEDLRRSAILETKQRLRDSLIRSKDQVRVEANRGLQLSRQVEELEQELKNAKDELRDARLRLQESNAERRKLEKTVQEKRSDRLSKSYSESPTDRTRPGALRSETERSSVSGASGLRELRLGKPVTGQIAPKRMSSFPNQGLVSTEDHQPTNSDELLVELVNAKTSEAMAKQELDEVKAKLDALRRMMSAPLPPINTGPSGHRSNESEAAVTGSGTASKKPTNEAVAAPSSSMGLSSLWGWGKKNLTSANVSDK